MVRDEKDDRLLPRQNRMSRLTKGVKSSKTSGNRKESSSDKRSKNPCRYFVIKTSCKFSIFLCVKTTSLSLDANMEEHISSDILRQKESPVKGQRKVVRKDQLRYWRSQSNWFVYLTILVRKNPFYVKRKIGIKTCRQILQGHLAPKKSGKKVSIGRNCPTVWTSWA